MSRLLLPTYPTSTSRLRNSSRWTDTCQLCTLPDRVVLGDVVDARIQRAEVRRHVQPFRIPLLRRPEAGRRRRVRAAQPLRGLLRDAEPDDVGAVERQQVLAAEPVEVDVAHAVAAAQDGLAVDRVGKARAAARSCCGRVDQRPVVDRAVLRLQQRVGVRVEVGEEVVRLPLRRRDLVAQPEVQRQVLERLDVVLHVGEVHALAQVGDERVDQRVGVARAEHEVGQVVGRRIRGGAGGAAELPAVGVAAVLRVEVVDLRVDRLVLVAGLEALAAADPRVVDARD